MLHFVDCDIGPRGDVPQGSVSIHGDRWSHHRIGMAVAPESKLTNAVEAARIESVTGDVTAGSPATITIANTEGLAVGDSVYIEDDDSGEQSTISYITPNASIQADLLNSYTADKHCTVSQVKTVTLESSTGFAVDDLVIFEAKTGDKYFHAEIDSISGNDISVRKLLSSFSKEDFCRTYCTSNWTRPAAHLIGLQNEYPWDWAGQGVKAPHFMPDVDIQTKEE